MYSDSSSDSEDGGPDWGQLLKNRVCYKDTPGIINDKLLEELLWKQMEGNQDGKLLLENGIEFEKITEIRIEFCKILRIDHLWMMKRLKVLKMGNNFIEKIENLEELTELVELDLSFNRITKIENLDNLANLKEFSLFDNAISEIENMENLKNLTIFSIGKNDISDRKNIIYLRRLPKLRSLNMADNPCCTDRDFKYYIATYLPNLTYYEYRAITKIERKIGDDLFHVDYHKMLEKEKIELANKYKREKEEYDAKMNAESFVEYLDTRRLFDSLFDNDREGSTLLLIGGEVKNLLADYEEDIVYICMDIFRMGQKQYGIRQNNLNEFNDNVKLIQLQFQTEAIGRMEHFLKEKSEILDQLKNLNWTSNNDQKLKHISQELEEKFMETSNSTWKDLMKLECALYEEMMELNETYEHGLVDLINNFIEQAQEMFVTMRQTATDFNDCLEEIALAYYATVILEAEKDRLEAEKKEEHTMKHAEVTSRKSTKIEMVIRNVSDTAISKAVGEDAEIKKEEYPRKIIPSELSPYVQDRETLRNTLAGSRDAHLLMIDNREDLLVSKAREWQHVKIRSLYQKEIKRNREKVLEINNFLNIQNNEFDLLASEMQNNLVNVESSYEVG